MDKKLKFRVVHFSSEDPDFPASQLNTVHPTTKGWQSVRFASYPQELGFEMLDGYVNIHQIQVLNHQANISSKIEIYIGTGDTYDTATWKRLGYMSIDSNEKSNYQARELKTVFVDSFGQYLKLILNENHHNHLNIFNQVGIIALNLTGVPAQESKSVPHQPVAKVNPSKPPSKNVYTDLSADLNLDPQTAGKLRQLAEAKGRAIDNEDYLTAKQIKSVEQELKALGSRLAQLDLAKAEAVASEDYDLAKEIKDQCDDLRKEIDRKIRAIEIPGVRLTTPQAPAQPKTHAKPPRFSKDENDSYDDEIVVQKKVMNVDDIVVGGGGGGTSGKKVAKVESFHMSSFDDNIGHPSGGGDDHYYDEPMQNDDTQGDDRPIKPKSNMDYNDRDPTVETNDDGMNTGMPTEKFPVGEHPLEGIPGFLDLPTPEQLTIKSREYSEQSGILKLMGEYRARCLFSKNWNLRDAVLLKIQQLIDTEYRSELSSAIPPVCAFLKVGVEDKMQQVVITAVRLLEQVLKAAKSGKVPRSIVAPAMDQVINQLIDKLADGNSRIREQGRKGIDLVAASSQVGPAHVASHLVRALPPKLKTAWRPIAARLEILVALVTEFGLENNHGLHMDPMLNFAKTTQAFAHSQKEVRDAAKKLVVAIQKLVGTGPLEPTLALLRKNQREEYEAAFAAKDGVPDAKPSGGGAGAKGSKSEHSPKRTDMSQQHATHLPGGKVPTSQAKVQDQSHGYPQGGPQSKEVPGGGDGEEKQDFTSCMFCGFTNKKWSENDLDLHYWKDCPLLISCPSCAQIVEIAGLPEHLLDECEAKDDYLPCETTGLAIRKAEFAAWQKSPLCVPAPDNFMYCPLCLSTVEDSDSAWLNHLTKKCKKNARIQAL